MKKFLKKISFFFGILLLYKMLLFVIFFFNLSDYSQHSYYGAESVKPKIVLVGSSNLQYNIDYQLLNEHFIHYTTIGCHLSEPSGLFALYSNLEKLALGEQDIVIFCLPHSLYETDKFLPLRNHKKANFSKALLADCAKKFPIEFINSVSAIKLLTVKSLDAAPSKKARPPKISYQKSPEIHSDSLYKSCWVNPEEKFFIKSTGFNASYLNKIIDFLSNQLPSKILFRYPSIRKDLFDIDTDRISFLNKEVHFINTFDRSIYPSEYWFNQWYHLNRCGRDLNSKKLIEELEPILSALNKQ